MNYEEFPEAPLPLVIDEDDLSYLLTLPEEPIVLLPISAES